MNVSCGTLFINDLDSDLLSSLLKFADDTKVFTRVNDEKGREQLQADFRLSYRMVGEMANAFQCIQVSCDTSRQVQPQV